MARWLAIARRELMAYFLSPTAYVVMFVFLLMNGITFYYYATSFDGYLTVLFNSVYGGYSFWVLQMLVPPLLTMRSFSEERRSGTFELLATSGVGEASMVWGKFFSAYLYYALLWAALAPLLWIVARFGTPEWGVVIAYQLGILQLGALFTAIGILASAATANQLIAAVAAVTINLMIFFAGFFQSLFPAGDLRLRYLEYVSPLHHFSSDYTNGVFDLRHPIFYGSCTAGVLFLAVKVLERRRWW